VEDLKLQLQLFRRKRPRVSVEETAALMMAMVPEVRGEFIQVEKLVRILLVSPASSAVAERSFSALRRLKTWLRSTMSQVRLNSVAVCHIHQDKLDALDINALVNSFIDNCSSRSLVFGKKQKIVVIDLSDYTSVEC